MASSTQISPLPNAFISAEAYNHLSSDPSTLVLPVSSGNDLTKVDPCQAPACVNMYLFESDRKILIVKEHLIVASSC